jgi:hypothetical protein
LRDRLLVDRDRLTKERAQLAAENARLLARVAELEFENGQKRDLLTALYEWDMMASTEDGDFPGFRERIREALTEARP